MNVTTLNRREALAAMQAAMLAPETLEVCVVSADGTPSERIEPRPTEPNVEKLVILLTAALMLCEQIDREHGKECRCNICVDASHGQWFLAYLRDFFANEMIHGSTETVAEMGSRTGLSSSTVEPYHGEYIASSIQYRRRVKGN